MSRFAPPTSEQISEAIGSLDDIPSGHRHFFDPRDFSPICRPGPSDWLMEHRERGQSYARFLEEGPRCAPFRRCQTIAIQPFVVAPSETAPDALSLPEAISWLSPALRRYCEAFFQLPVVLRPPLNLETSGFDKRISAFEPHQRQWRTGSFTDFLARRASQHVTEGVICEVAVLVEDLYNKPDWNFVFGEARSLDGVGVFSFFRYLPGWENGEGIRPLSPPERAQFLVRCCKVMAHEIGHLFGIRHCTFFQCLMCGSNHIGEFDRKPATLCPVDLHKLAAALKNVQTPAPCRSRPSAHLLTLDFARRYALLADALEAGGCPADDPFVQRFRERAAGRGSAEPNPVAAPGAAGRK